MSWKPGLERENEGAETDFRAGSGMEALVCHTHGRTGVPIPRTHAAKKVETGDPQSKPAKETNHISDL